MNTNLKNLEQLARAQFPEPWRAWVDGNMGACISSGGKTVLIVGFNAQGGADMEEHDAQ